MGHLLPTEPVFLLAIELSRAAVHKRGLACGFSHLGSVAYRYLCLVPHGKLTNNKSHM